jgi:hypothetical protein
MKKQRKQKKDQFLGASTKSKRNKIRGGGFLESDSLDEVKIGMAHFDEGKTRAVVKEEFSWADPADIDKILDRGPPK